MYTPPMAYDDNARKLVIKVIGTVESGLNYEAINYGDPITVGIAQWYGTRAANILCRMRDENPGSWNGVAASINNGLALIPADNPQWNEVRLTQAEGESLRPVLNANRAIQDDQCITDMDVYKQVAINSGMDPESNTNSVIFFFTMYHQGPVYAFQVLEAVGPNATLEQFRDGALGNPVLGQYSNRYNEAYEIIKKGDISDTEPPETGTPETPATPAPTPPPVLRYIETSGQSLLLHFEAETLTCYPTGTSRWLPSRQLTPATPPPTAPADPPAPTDPPASSGEWIHPLPGSVLTSGYGYRQGLDQPGLIHAGIDCSTTTAARGGNIVAPCDLEITQAMNAGAGGFEQAGGFVKGITRSGTPYTLTFIHMAAGSVAVSKGDIVKRGTVLGVEGQTGNVTGTHLHFEMWPGHIRSGFSFDGPWYFGDGTPINPEPILKANGVTL